MFFTLFGYLVGGGGASVIRGAPRSYATPNAPCGALPRLVGGRRLTRGGDRRRGNTPLLRAAEMRRKTSGSDGGRGGSSAGGDGGGESRGADSDPVAPVVAEAEEGTGPVLSPPPAGGGEKGYATPASVSCGPTPPGSPRLARLGAWRFAGLGSSGPNVEEGRVPSILGGAVHRRVAGGPELGRAREAGQACHS